jgi:hypothetical protein
MKALNGGRGRAPELRRYKDVGWRSGNLVFPYDEGPLHESWLGGPLPGASNSGGEGSSAIGDPSIVSPPSPQRRDRQRPQRTRLTRRPPWSGSHAVNRRSLSHS